MYSRFPNSRRRILNFNVLDENRDFRDCPYPEGLTAEQKKVLDEIRTELLSQNRPRGILKIDYSNISNYLPDPPSEIFLPDSDPRKKPAVDAWHKACEEAQELFYCTPTQEQMAKYLPKILEEEEANLRAFKEVTMLSPAQFDQLEEEEE